MLVTPLPKSPRLEAVLTWLHKALCTGQAVSGGAMFPPEQPLQVLPLSSRLLVQTGSADTTSRHHKKGSTDINGRHCRHRMQASKNQWRGHQLQAPWK